MRTWGHSGQFVIRIDGIVLGLTIVGGLAVFGCLTLVFLMGAVLRRRPLVSPALTVSGSLFGVHVAALLLLQLGKEKVIDLSRPDWLDWLSVPWIGFVIAGLVAVMRSRGTGTRS